MSNRHHNEAVKIALDALRPFCEIADSYNSDTWRAGPSPLYAVLDDCRAARDARKQIHELCDLPPPGTSIGEMIEP